MFWAGLSVVSVWGGFGKNISVVVGLVIFVCRKMPEERGTSKVTEATRSK